MSQIAVSVKRWRSVGDGVARENFLKKVGLYVVLKMFQNLNKSNMKDLQFRKKKQKAISCRNENELSMLIKLCLFGQRVT